MMDVNERALQLAKDNAELNRIKNVNIYESDRLAAVNEAKVCCNSNKSSNSSW